MPRKPSATTLVQKKMNEIKELMKSQGVYQVGLDMQIKLVAQLAIKTDIAFSKTLECDSVKTQISREGNEREVLNGNEILYERYSEKLQRGLRALGLNYDSKATPSADDNDILAFLEKVKGENV